MSNTNVIESEPKVFEPFPTLEAIVEYLKGSPLGHQIVDLLTVVDVVDGCIDGVVLDDTQPDGGYVDREELVGRQTYLVLGLGNLTTHMQAGIHPLDTQNS